MIADLGGDGRRQVFWASSAPSGCARLTARELAGRALWYHDFPSIPGTASVWNTGGIILWQTGHYTDRRRQDVLVTIRRSMMHSEETVLLFGRDGRELWRRARQISQRGVDGTPFAVADFDGDGLDDAASLHPRILYVLEGATGSASADMDSDGREEAVFVLGNALVCLGAAPDSRRGEIRWQIELPARIGPPSVAVLRVEPTIVTMELVMSRPGGSLPH